MSPGILPGGCPRGSKGNGNLENPNVDEAQRAAKTATTTRVAIINPNLMLLFI